MKGPFYYATRVHASEIAPTECRDQVAYQASRGFTRSLSYRWKRMKLRAVCRETIVRRWRMPMFLRSRADNWRIRFYDEFEETIFSRLTKMSKERCYSSDCYNLWRVHFINWLTCAQFLFSIGQFLEARLFSPIPNLLKNLQKEHSMTRRRSVHCRKWNQTRPKFLTPWAAKWGKRGTLLQTRKDETNSNFVHSTWSAESRIEFQARTESNSKSAVVREPSPTSSRLDLLTW